MPLSLYPHLCTSSLSTEFTTTFFHPLFPPFSTIFPSPSEASCILHLQSSASTHLFSLRPKATKKSIKILPHTHTHITTCSCNYIDRTAHTHTHTSTRIVAIAGEIDFLNANALHMSDGMRLEKSMKNVANKKSKCEKKEDEIPQQFEASFFVACFSFTLQSQVSFSCFFFLLLPGRTTTCLLFQVPCPHIGWIAL